MNKLGRLAQWGKEKMAGDSKNSTTDDFKALEMEMNMRHEGIEKMHGSMSTYTKNLTQRVPGEGKEKVIPIALLGTTMTRHGEMFEEGNKFGESLLAVGQVNERIARMQETYASQATSSWLEALERSVAQMKDYQAAKKKLDSRRSAYDSTMAKIQKAKKEDYKIEEDLRTQKAKYEESTEDVYRRMQDIVDSEKENIEGLYAFLEAELNFHDRAREVLFQLKRNWPAPSTSGNYTRPSPTTRSRSSTLDRFRAAQNLDDDDLPPPPLPFRSQPPSGTASPSRELPGFDLTPSRSNLSRTSTNDSLSVPRPNLTRNATADSAYALRQPTPLRTLRPRQASAGDVFGDPSDDVMSSSPDKYWENERSSSPATSVTGGASYGSSLSRNTSWDSTSKPFGNIVSGNVPANKKAPPPPPSRGTKPPPPPPPKRSTLGTTVSYSG